MNECPFCGSYDVSKIWIEGRKLQNVCNSCNSKIGEAKLPEKEPISNIRSYNFGGYTYEVFDKYGYKISFSKSYVYKEQAIEQIKDILEKGKHDIAAGPYTIVLWPKKIY